MSNQTAVQWLYDQIKGHFDHDQDSLDSLRVQMIRAKQMERQQHGNTWNAAIQAHEDRGHNTARSIPDFDEYEIQ